MRAPAVKRARPVVGVRLEELKPGDALVICAADDFFAFVDGWRGRFAGVNCGAAVVECMRPDGMKTLFVPPAQLARSVLA